MIIICTIHFHECSCRDKRYFINYSFFAYFLPYVVKGRAIRHHIITEITTAHPISNNRLQRITIVFPVL